MIVGVMTMVCAVSIVMICVRGARTDIYPTPSPSENHVSGVELTETFDYGDGYIKKLIFIADKTIYPISSLNPEIEADQVWSTIGGTLPLDNNLKTTAIIHQTDDVKGCSIPSAAQMYKPQYVIITAGLENGVPYCNKERFKEYYKDLIIAIEEACPSTKIILQSVLPVSKATEKASPNISNDRIDEANAWIMELCNDCSVRYLNTASILKDADGYLCAEFDSGDGITLNAEGYKAVIQYVRTHGYK